MMRSCACDTSRVHGDRFASEDRGRLGWSLRRPSIQSPAFLSQHIGSGPGVAGLSGIQVKPLVPLRSVRIPPFGLGATIVALSATFLGAAFMALATSSSSVARRQKPNPPPRLREHSHSGHPLRPAARAISKARLMAPQMRSHCAEDPCRPRSSAYQRMLPQDRTHSAKIIDYMESTADPPSAIIAFRLAETIKIYVDQAA